MKFTHEALMIVAEDDLLEDELDEDELDEDEGDNECPHCGRFVPDDEWVSYYDACQMCCEDPDIVIEDEDDFDDEEDEEDE